MSSINTANSYVPIIPLKKYNSYEIALEDLEFVFTKNQLHEITVMHNNGVWVTDIAKNIKRNEYEVLIALIHQHRKGKLTKELAHRRK